jgi:hypothetical protein
MHSQRTQDASRSFARYTVDSKRTLSNAPLVYLISLCLFSCADNKELLRETQSIRALILAQNKRLDAMDQEMHDGFRIALCRPEIRQLLEDVRSECTPLLDPKDPNSRKAAAEPAMCETKKIHPAVMSADPEHKGRFLKFMTLLRHEAMYIRKGAREILQIRRERLEKFAAMPVLKNTVILIVAHPLPKDPDGNLEALRRAKMIAAKIQQHNQNVTDDKIAIWVYAFPVSKEEIDNPTDLPSAGEIYDLASSVWVFRADC